MYDIFILSKDSQYYNFQESTQTYVEALERMRYMEGLLEAVENETFYFVSKEFNILRKLPFETISYFIKGPKNA